MLSCNESNNKEKINKNNSAKLQSSKNLVAHRIERKAEIEGRSDQYLRGSRESKESEK